MLYLHVSSFRASGGNLYKLLILYRKFQLESTSPGFIFPHSDGTMMVINYGRYDSQSETSATLASRKIRLEDARADAWINTDPIVRNFKHYYFICGIDCGGHCDARGGLAGSIRLDRRNSVVE
jgi:hypothetical protein